MATASRAPLALAVVLVVGPTAFAQDLPSPNPRPNAWGSNTYYCGDDTQFSSINTTINGASSGDEIVVTSGMYTEGISVNTPDLTIRPETRHVPAAGAAAATAAWESPTFWNPTEGPDASNNSAITLGSNTNNVYIGRPREFRRLANGNIVANQVPVGNGVVGANTTREWASINDPSDSGATMTTICNTSFTSMTGAASDANALQGTYTTGGGAGNDITNNMVCFNFWSRSMSKAAILTSSSKATISWCSITAQSGFGGGAVCDGAADTTHFVRCTFQNMWANGDVLTGTTLPVCTISCNGGAPTFSGCVVRANVGDDDHGIIYAGNSSNPAFINCYIASNTTPISDGIVCVDTGASASFMSCTFDSNQARFGTVYFNSTATADANVMLFANCFFTANKTIDLQYGAGVYATDSAASRTPMVAFDFCSFMNTGQTNGTDQGTAWYTKDIRTNYSPECRLLNDISNQQLSSAGAAVGSSAEEGPDGLFGDLSGDGFVGGADLALLLGAWSQ